MGVSAAMTFAWVIAAIWGSVPRPPAPAFAVRAANSANPRGPSSATAGGHPPVGLGEQAPGQSL